MLAADASLVTFGAVRVRLLLSFVLLGCLFVLLFGFLWMFGCLGLLGFSCLCVLCYDCALPPCGIRGRGSQGLRTCRAVKPESATCQCVCSFHGICSPLGSTAFSSCAEFGGDLPNLHSRDFCQASLHLSFQGGFPKFPYPKWSAANASAENCLTMASAKGVLGSQQALLTLVFTFGGGGWCSQKLIL